MNIAIFVLILTLTVTACDIMLDDGGRNAGLQASGVIEAVDIVIAPEIGGRVANVMVSEGVWVDAGEVLFQIEDKLLVAQQSQAQAALRIAEANYALIAAGLTGEQKAAGITAAELELENARVSLEKLSDDTDLIAAQALQQANTLEKELENLLNSDLQKALAMQAMAEAQKAVETAERRERTVSSSADEADIAAAQAQVVLAKDALDDAREDFEPYDDKPEDNLQRAQYQSKLAAAQQVYDAAVRKLNALKGTGSQADKAVAEADLFTAQAQFADAEREWNRVKDGPKEADILLLEAQIAKAYRTYETYNDGPDPDDVSLAQNRLANAQAQLALAKAESPTQESLDIAQAQVESARANLEALQVQIDLLIIESPVAGVVMTRNIEPGEVLQPGLAAMTIGRLDQLTVTVYLPEDRYGTIDLGDSATLQVDSYPETIFQATVTRIADQAEYTPRNVQTKEDRQTTVYAIDLAVNDPENLLKPGMPADVTFNP
jgi:multidrug resistance efflux pump